MFKKWFLLFLLILSCQKEWLDNEKKDFIARCSNPAIFLETNIDNKSDDLGSFKMDEHKRNSFCNCLLNQLVLLDLNYDEFLKKDLEDLINQKQLSNACLVD